MLGFLDIPKYSIGEKKRQWSLLSSTSSATTSCASPLQIRILRSDNNSTNHERGKLQDEREVFRHSNYNHEQTVESQEVLYGRTARVLKILRVIEKGGRYMLEIKRLPDEDENRYIYRVCKQKDLIGTWEDVADLLNAELGHDYGESAYRKKFNYFERMFDSNLDDLIGDESADKVRELKDELRTERYKLQALNLSKTREMRQNSRFELFYEQIADNVNRIKPEPMDIGYPKDWHPKTGGKGYVLALADIHYGANFKVATNEYSRAEAEARIKKLLKMTAEYLAEKDLEVIAS